MTRGYEDTMVVQLTPSADSTNFSLVILQGKNKQKNRDDSSPRTKGGVGSVSIVISIRRV
jgi:hypothetical protein